MNRVCGNCGAASSEAGLVACPACKKPYSASEEEAQKRLSDREELIARRVQARMVKPLVVAFSLLATVFGFGLWQIYTEVRDFASAQIKKKFDEPNIRATFTEVANQQAADLMRTQLQPEVDGAKLRIAEILQRIGPRQLSQEQEAATVAAIRPFAGETVNLFVYTGGETSNFAAQLEGVLQKASWQIRGRIQGDDHRSISGVLVEVDGAAGPSAQAAAAALAQVWTGGKLQKRADVAWTGYGVVDASGEITVTVGWKP